MQIITAKASFVRNSPRKTRLIADAIRGLTPTEAVVRLKSLNKRATEPVLKVMQQAIGNAKNNFGVSPADLRVKSIQVMGGPHVGKKADVHAHGARFDRGVRVKTLSHLLVELETIERKNITTTPKFIEPIKTVEEKVVKAVEKKVVKKTVTKKKEVAKNGTKS